MKESISLIGMAGAGKSSIGKKLAKHLDFCFVDSDKLIESNQNKPLQEILVQSGVKGFKKFEESALLSIELNKTILATGGSAIFSKNAMNYIKENSLVIYLEVSFEEILKRVSDFTDRGFVKESDQTIQQAFNARESLYREFADHIVQNNADFESCYNKILRVI